MTRDEAVRRIREHLAELEPFGVASLAVFGSTARNEAGAASDIDVLVEFDHAPGLREFMGLKFALEALLASPVDLVDRAALRPGWREVIEQDAVLVA